MHTPDGFLTSWVCVLMMFISLVAVGWSVFSIRKTLDKKKGYMMAGLCALVFGLQMLNFSIGNGTSGHLIGAALVALVLGRHASVIVMTIVVTLQALVYADGGIMALGANVFNMGIIAAYSADSVAKLFKDKMPLVKNLVASWASVIVAAFSASMMLWLSGAVGLGDVLTAMLGSHAFIGVGEAIITGFAVYAINSFKLSSDIKLDKKLFLRNGMIALFASVLVVSIALPFASSSPDGLEKVAINLGFYENAVELYSMSPMPDYTLIGSEAYMFVLASGLVGMALCFGVGFGTSKLLISNQ